MCGQWKKLGEILREQKQTNALLRQILDVLPRPTETASELVIDSDADLGDLSGMAEANDASRRPNPYKL